MDLTALERDWVREHWHELGDDQKRAYEKLKSQRRYVREQKVQCGRLMQGLRIPQMVEWLSRVLG